MIRALGRLEARGQLDALLRQDRLVLALLPHIESVLRTISFKRVVQYSSPDRYRLAVDDASSLQLMYEGGGVAYVLDCAKRSGGERISLSLPSVLMLLHKKQTIVDIGEEYISLCHIPF